MVLLIAMKMSALLMKTKALARTANCVARQRFSLYDSVGGRNAMPAKHVVKWDAPFNDHVHWPPDTGHERDKMKC